jgi:nitrite reductase (NADH) large subunit
VPAAGPARSFRGVRVEALWTDRSLQRCSGLLIVLAALGSMAFSRLQRRRAPWRAAVARAKVSHGALGAAAIVGLACHTGLHVGERLNRILAIDFVMVSALGGAAALATAFGDGSRSRVGWRLLGHAHLLVLIPLPVLLALHVLAAYWF